MGKLSNGATINFHEINFYFHHFDKIASREFFFIFVVKCQPPGTDIPVWITVGKTDSQVDAQYSTVSRFQNWRLEDLTLEWATVGKTDSQVVAQHPIVARFPKSRLGGMGLEWATAGKTDTQVDTQ